MSVTVMSLVFGANIPDLKGETNTPNSTAKFVLLALADHASDDGENAYCGIRRLIQKTGFTTSTVCNTLKNLIANNYIRYDGKSRVKTNKYAINLQLLESLRFQPLESHDSSQWNQTVLATGAKPSVNHPLKPSDTERAKTTRSDNPATIFFANGGKGITADERAILASSKITDLERWGQVVKAYIGCGWSARNYTAMADWYNRNEIPHKREAAQAQYKKPAESKRNLIEVIA